MISLLLWLASIPLLVFLVVDASMYGVNKTSILGDRVFVLLSFLSAVFILLTFAAVTTVFTHDKPVITEVQPYPFPNS